MVGARYKTTRYILSSLDVKGEYTPDFLDLQAFVNYDLSRQWKLSWIGNINRSHFELIPESSTVAKGSFFQILNLNTEFEGSEDDYFEQNMTGLSLNYISDQSRYPFFMKWNAALYYGYEAERFDILGYYRLVEVEAGQNDEEGKEVKLWGVGTQHLYARNRLESIVQHYEWRGAIDFLQPAPESDILCNGVPGTGANIWMTRSMNGSAWILQDMPCLCLIPD
ncbi:MAG: hypothetical protein IPM92_09045 [Saprospiraceae bacterium]|nr:hypothetical protein [Saprospiraceae bacterium]